MNEDKTTLPDILGELDAGIFEAKILGALKLVALGVVESGKKGNVTISLNLSQIGDSHSVQVEHTLKYQKPTRNGKTTEENTTTTPMYVNKDGSLTISPQLQADLFTADKTNSVIKLRK